MPKDSSRTQSDEIVCIGIDVQVRRPCAVVALDSQCRMLFSGWLEGGSGEFVCDDLIDRLDRVLGGIGAWHFGIDTPPQPLMEKRDWFWDRKAANWRARRGSDRGWGRHCEVVIRSCSIANPQWTPGAAKQSAMTGWAPSSFRGPCPKTRRPNC